MEIREYVNKGGILVEMIFDFHIKTDNVDDVKGIATEFCNDFINTNISNGNIYFAVAEVETPEKGENYTSTYAKITILFKSFQELLQTVINYNPVSIEILAIKNDKLEIDVGSLQDVLNEVSKQVYDIKTMMLTDDKKKELEEIYRKRLEKGKRIFKND